MSLEVNKSFLEDLVTMKSYLQNVLQSLQFDTEENKADFSISEQVFHYNSIKAHVMEIVNRLELVIFNYKHILYLYDKMNVKYVGNRPIITNITPKIGESKLKLLNGNGQKTTVINEQNESLKESETEFNGEKPELHPKPVIRSKSCLPLYKGHLTVQKMQEHFLKIGQNSNSTSMNNIHGQNDTKDENKYKLTVNGTRNLLGRVSRSYSLKYLGDWEKIWDNNNDSLLPCENSFCEKQKQSAIPTYSVSRRVRQYEHKNKKRISSTVEGFLDFFESSSNRRCGYGGEKREFSSLGTIPTMEEGKEEESVELIEKSHTKSGQSNVKRKEVTSCIEEDTLVKVRNELMEVKAKSIGNISECDFSPEYSNKKILKVPRVINVVYKKKEEKKPT